MDFVLATAGAERGVEASLERLTTASLRAPETGVPLPVRCTSHKSLSANETKWLTMSSIVTTPDVLGGEPRIEGTRVGVLSVTELVVGGEYSPADVADQFDLSLGEVHAALAYYYDHPEEMRELRREREEVEARLAEEALQPPKPAR